MVHSSVMEGTFGSLDSPDLRVFELTICTLKSLSPNKLLVLRLLRDGDQWHSIILVQGDDINLLGDADYKTILKQGNLLYGPYGISLDQRVLSPSVDQATLLSETILHDKTIMVRSALLIVIMNCSLSKPAILSLVLIELMSRGLISTHDCSRHVCTIANGSFAPGTTSGGSPKARATTYSFKNP
ncbi:hypothetical protein VNO77_03294 [Canavalia gladiata]|uniref:Uncharacterized protein n=1 Tax=Canavalia gladiata TaxID=3824 RepID=A0AAN9MV86_CANGL